MESHLRPQWIRGRASRQAHADLPDGTVEEEHGREGFSGPASHLYRLHPPTGWISIDGPLRPHALDANRLVDGAGDGEVAAADLPTALLGNDDLVISFWSRPAGTPDWFYRDADGDLLYLVHQGEGRLETEYGPLPYRASDYLLVPRGTTHRFAATAPTQLLAVEAVNGRLELPDRGLLGRHALFDPAILDVPEPEPVDEAGEFPIRVKRENQVTTVVYPHHPCDVVGWKGDLAPLRLSIHDFRPVTSARYHVPPSAHTTFVGSQFVVATFAPRPLETDPAVLRVPFYHRNIDYDEVIFYHRGEFFSRAGITEGMLTFHPTGIHHGPQPKAVERSQEKGPGGFADEIAVNIDARRPLHLTGAGASISVEGYDRSWQP
ncbi:MAG TPA: homogentisate 1,2-dioxygenase, partial [Acidimicrobiia bacterium]|nr:homogentisate 1,2-dioxygenase [Acidimicrobiia bacterium]